MAQQMEHLPCYLAYLSLTHKISSMSKPDAVGGITVSRLRKYEEVRGRVGRLLRRQSNSGSGSGELWSPPRWQGWEIHFKVVLLSPYMAHIKVVILPPHISYLFDDVIKYLLIH